jgi:predicted RNase H-like HicB family nuclease
MPYTALYVQSRDGKAVLGFVLEVPGAHAQGATIEETREHLRDALRLTLNANRRRSYASAKGMRQIRTEPMDEMP